MRKRWSGKRLQMSRAGPCAATQITENPPMTWLNAEKWDAQGLVPVIAQEQGTGDDLMLARMSREAMAKTAKLGSAG